MSTVEHEMEVEEVIDNKENPTAFRNMVKQVSGKHISSVQASQFLELFEHDLNSDITHTKRLFIEKHFGKK